MGQTLTLPWARSGHCAASIKPSKGAKMLRRLRRLVAVGAAVALAVPAAAAGDTTLGTTTPPSGSTADACGADVMGIQIGSDASTPYTVPSPGELTQWQTNTAGDTTGD